MDRLIFDMTSRFLPQMPRDFLGQPILMSGQESTELSYQEYLVLEDSEEEKKVFEIRYDGNISPFKEVIIF
jgi:hypothetical protein